MNTLRQAIRAALVKRPFRELIQQVDAIIWAADPATGRYTFVSRRAEEILGYPVERWLAEPEFGVKLLHPEDREQTAARYRTAVREGRDCELEYRAVAADGCVVWLRNVIHVVQDREGRAEKLRGAMVDITARKKAEAALEDSEERYRLAASATNDVIRDWNLRTDEVVWSETLRRVFGYAPEEVSSALADAYQWWTDRIHPEDRERVVGRFQAALEAGEDVWSIEYRFRRADGSYATVVDRNYIARNERGDPVRAGGSMTDITARRQAEAALQARARQQASVADLARRALEGAELPALMDEAVALVAQTLEVEHGELLELLPDGHALRLRAGLGWREGLVGRATVGTGRESHAGYTLVAREPVIVEDLRSEARFSGSPLLRDHGVVSGLSVIIRGPARPFGVLGAHTTRRRTFTQDDVAFLQAVANVLAMAVQRQRAEAERAEILAREQAARVEAEAARLALAESEACYRAIGESLPFGVWICNPDGGVRYLSDAFLHLVGMTLEECAQFGWTSRLPPEDVDRTLTDWKRCVETGDLWDYEHRILGVDGRYHTILSRGVPVRDAGGRIECWAGINLDITERKRTEEALRESQGRLAGVIESAMDAIITIDAEQRITVFNRAAEQIFLCPAATALGQPIDRFIPAHFRRAHAEHIRTFGRTGVTSRSMRTLGALMGLRADGEEFPLEASISQVEVGGQKLFTVILRDITERKRSEDAQRFLVEASAKLAASLDYETTLASVARLAVGGPADWCVVDLLGADRAFRTVAVAYADPARAPLARELRRYPPEPSRPHPASEVLRTGRPELVAEVTDAWLGARAGDEAHLKLLRALGVRSAMIVPLAAGGQTLGLLTFLAAESGRRYGPADLTVAEELARRAALAVDNARLYREAQEAIRVREEFLSRASHELRTPLTVVKGHLALLEKRLSRTEPGTASLVTVAQRHTDRMVRLIADLLDAFRLQAGQLTLGLEPLDLKAVVAEALVQVAPLAQAQGVVLIAEGAGGLTLVGDRLKLEQVVINLLTNAIKHTPAGGVIRVDGQGAGNEVQLRVRDTGDGIAREHLERIFEPFFQVGSATGYRKAAGQGAGLGLALVRGLVALHGGRIWAESEGPGRGSTFVVRLPAAASGENRAAS